MAYAFGIAAVLMFVWAVFVSEYAVKTKSATGVQMAMMYYSYSILLLVLFVSFFVWGIR